MNASTPFSAAKPVLVRQHFRRKPEILDPKSAKAQTSAKASGDWEIASLSFLLATCPDLQIVSHFMTLEVDGRLRDTWIVRRSPRGPKLLAFETVRLNVRVNARVNAPMSARRPTRSS